MVTTIVTKLGRYISAGGQEQKLGDPVSLQECSWKPGLGSIPGKSGSTLKFQLSSMLFNEEHLELGLPSELTGIEVDPNPDINQC